MRPRLTYANVVATLALFAALGGASAFAATQLAKNSVGARQIKKGAVTPTKLSKAAKAKLTGPPGRDGAPGTVVSLAGNTLHSGETVTGNWALSVGTTGIAYEAVTLPVPAPQPINSEHAVVGATDGVPGDGCTGTASAPVAAPGFACAYVATSNNVDSEEGIGSLGYSSNPSPGDGSASGFLIVLGGFAKPWYATGTWAYTAP